MSNLAFPVLFYGIYGVVLAPRLVTSMARVRFSLDTPLSNSSTNFTNLIIL